MIAVDRIKYFADLSIRRACGFGFIAVVTGMVGTAWSVALAVKTGAVGVTLMGAILVYKALRAPAKPYKSTEVWLLLERHHDLPEARAQQVFGNIMRERYLWHATRVALVALVLWLLVFGLAVVSYLRTPP
jgi:hypothetical protein